MTKTQHDKIAENIAAKKKTPYHSDKGVDIRTSTQAIEVEVKKETLKEGIRQLRGTTKAPYLAVPQKIVKEALDITKNSGIGVMNQTGRIVKRAKGRK